MKHLIRLMLRGIGRRSMSLLVLEPGVHGRLTTGRDDPPAGALSLLPRDETFKPNNLRIHQRSMAKKP